MKPFIEYIIRYRSLVGVICLVVVLYLSKPQAMSIFIGFFLIVGGMIFRAWSSGFINKDKELATGGPYSLTRNPLYFGNFLLGLGIAVAGNNFYVLIIFFCYFLLFFPLLMVIEHKRMKQKFGGKYDEWARGLNSFFPKIKRVQNRDFNISFYMKNKEYRVLFFSLFIIGFYIIKYLQIIRFPE